MKTFVLCLAVFFILLVLSANTFAANKEDALAAMNKSISTYNSKEYQAYSTYLADDLEVFKGIGTPLLSLGKLAWMASVNGPGKLPSVSYPQQQNTVRVHDGNTTVINGYSDITVVDKNGSMTTETGRNTTTMVKQDGKWIVVSLHFSGMFR